MMTSSGAAETLLERGLVTAADLARVEDVRARTGGRFAATITRLGLAPEEELARLLGEQAGLPVLTGIDLPDTVTLDERLNPLFLQRRALLPIDGDEIVEDGDATRVAMADPTDTDALDGLRFALGRAVTPVVATFSDIADLLARSVDAMPSEIGADTRDGDGALDDAERLLEGDSEAPVIRVVRRLLTDAANRHASDIHIEPMARHVAVRFRVDGRLIEVERLGDALGPAIARRIKVMAALDIAEARLPQDGRLRATVRGREIDVRVSTSPTAWGESIVLRLLARGQVSLDLDQLGLPTLALARLNHALDRPHGIILLTGPTGSGKTTTLYAALNRLKRPEVKILTVEDPVEILLEGINQVQVRPEIDLSYAATLRAFLRQDPDILMIGEIRDVETAEIAMRAALTGHLVLSTLHTNSALGAFTRLADIGVEPFLTASTVVATVAQRLIRKLCADCARDRPIEEAERRIFLEAEMALPAMSRDPVGCPACHGTGFRGRLPLIEMVEVDEDLRAAVREGQVERREVSMPPSETLLGHGLALVAAGQTTLPEVARAVHLA